MLRNKLILVMMDFPDYLFAVWVYLNFLIPQFPENLYVRFCK